MLHIVPETIEAGHSCYFRHPGISQIELGADSRVAEAALSNGKYAGTVGSPESMKELIDIGYRFINLGADVLGLYSYFSGLLDAAAGRTAIREVK
jgi:2-keto-3-deoxy-L-rhamnonate aldolase RhmA